MDKSVSARPTPAGEARKKESIKWHQWLKQYFHAHIAAFQISFRNLAITPVATIITILAIGVCLSLPTGLYLFVKNVQRLTQGVDKGSALTLYTHQKSSAQEIAELVNKIKEYPFVEGVTTLTPEQALKEFQAASNLKDILALLPDNPLPGVVSIQLNTQEASKSVLESMKNALVKYPAVKQAAFDYEWVEKLNYFLELSKAIARFIYLLIGIGVTLMVGNTIRLALERHREEIEVLGLVGATKAFIMRPFLYRGIIYGGLGGVIAALILSLGVHSLQETVGELATLYHQVFSLENLQLYDTVALLIASAGLGWIGAAIAFTQQNRLLLPASI